VLFTREQYARVAEALDLWPSEPRAIHEVRPPLRERAFGGSPTALAQGVIRARRGDQQILLVDRRLGRQFLNDEEALVLSPRAQFVTAKQGSSCADACLSQGKTCSGEDLEFANNCEALLRAFPCEAGCGHQIGTEIPCYVTDSLAATFQQCLVTDAAISNCAASHRSTSRLCVCRSQP
jgi:hypothetical protein